MLRTDSRSRQLSTTGALRHLEEPNAAVELQYPGERTPYYITKQEGDYYLTTSKSRVRNLSELMPEREIVDEIRAAFATAMRLTETPFGELVAHRP